VLWRREEQEGDRERAVIAPARPAHAPPACARPPPAPPAAPVVRRCVVGLSVQCGQILLTLSEGRANIAELHRLLPFKPLSGRRAWCLVRVLSLSDALSYIQVQN
jgi:hypothetical protein